MARAVAYYASELQRMGSLAAFRLGRCYIEESQRLPLMDSYSGRVLALRSVYLGFLNKIKPSSLMYVMVNAYGNVDGKCQWVIEGVESMSASCRVLVPVMNPGCLDDVERLGWSPKLDGLDNT
jgi:hypothetical protein